MRISDWSSDVCSSDLRRKPVGGLAVAAFEHRAHRHRRVVGARLHHLPLAVEAGQEAGPARRQRGGIVAGANVQMPVIERGGIGLERVIIAGETLHLVRSEEHTSELQSLMRISYAVFCLKKKNNTHTHHRIK